VAGLRGAAPTAGDDLSPYDLAAPVLWTALRPGLFAQPTGVLAAQRTAGASGFGAAETVTDQPPGANDSPPAVALDPSTAQPVVAFTARGGGLLLSARG
jgi:hypothetical protein